MIGRRGFLKGGAAAVTVRGGNPPMRPDQIANLPQTRAGSGPAPSSPFVVANRVIIIGPAPKGGLFVYSGTPALGNLIDSINAIAGLDPIGLNNVLPGLVSYGNAGANSRATQVINGFVQWYTAGSSGGPYTLVATAGITAADANDLQLSTFGPLSSAVTMQYGSGQLARLSTGRLADVSLVTVTTAVTPTDLFHDTIKGGEAVAGSQYKATAYGFGTWGSTQQSLAFSTRFGALASTVIGTQPTVDATAFAVNATFRWRMEALLTCTSPGATAKWTCNLSGWVMQNANAAGAIPLAAASNTVPLSGGTGSGLVTLDSTVDEVFGLSCAWAAVTGAPTITKVAGFMERIA